MTRLGLLEKDLASHRHRLGPDRSRRRIGLLLRGLLLHGGVGAGIVRAGLQAGLRGLLALLLQLLLGLVLGIEFEQRAALGAAARQIGGVDLPGIGGVEVGQQRTERIGGERRDRARLGAEAEFVQGERRPSWIKGHDDRSLTENFGNSESSFGIRQSMSTATCRTLRIVAHGRNISYSPGPVKTAPAEKFARHRHEAVTNREAPARSTRFGGQRSCSPHL